MRTAKPNQLFRTAPVYKRDSNSFDLSHNHIFSFDMGKLVPTYIEEVIPGDKFQIRAENFLRFSPLVSPVMHQVNVRTYTFFVPNRIIWEDWGKWITKDKEIEPPTITGLTEANGWSEGCIADYFGANKTSPNNTTQKISALPFAAYSKIFNEYFRNQNIVEDGFIPLVAGDNSADYRDMALGVPWNKMWEKDYFTSCNPWAQKGDPVTLPLLENDTADVYQVPWEGVPQGLPHFRNADGSAATPGTVFANGSSTVTSGGNAISYNPSGTLKVDINADATTINTLNRAIVVQHWLETNARAGTRYIEYNKAHYGVRSSDQRHQRPEYIGGTKQVMRISEVLATAQTVDQTTNSDIPVGNLSGHGISMNGGQRHTYRAEEHGFIITLMCAIPRTSYYQGLPRFFQRFDPWDYAIPSFANIGEQEVLVKELRNDVGTEEELNAVFGYQSQYADYKYHPSGISGDMRTTLEHYHLARKWELDDLPALNEEFITSNPAKRIFAVTDENIHSIYAQTFFDVRAIRKLPKFGIPSF